MLLFQLSQAALSRQKSRLEGGTRIEFFEELWNAEGSLLTEYFTKAKKARLVMELRLKVDAQDDFECVGDYYEYIDPYAEEIVYVS